MRVFEDLQTAESEIRRDLSKGAIVTSTRVQQKTGLKLQGRERLGYQYSILEVPTNLDEIMEFGKDHFEVYREHAPLIRGWYEDEIMRRLNPLDYYLEELDEEPVGETSEELHPLLKTTFEGNFPSYTYQARLTGAVELLTRALGKNPDTRRAFWPIYTPTDAQRMGDPTRIPCSLGYMPMIRDLGDGTNRLVMFYLERSCDFDHFWLSDVYLAHLFQSKIASMLGIPTGAFIHFIISFHSFTVETQEVY